MEMDSFKKLVTIIDRLRLECPWDRRQTFESLRNLTIEETYELADAILEKNWDDVKNELGDLLLHIVFYAKMGSEKNIKTLLHYIYILIYYIWQRSICLVDKA